MCEFAPFLLKYLLFFGPPQFRTVGNSHIQSCMNFSKKPFFGPKRHDSYRNRRVSDNLTRIVSLSFRTFTSLLSRRAPS